MRNKRKKNTIRKDTSAKAVKSYKKKKVVKIKVPRTRNGGTITEAAFFSKIANALRNGFKYWKPMMDALESVSRPSQDPNKRIKKEYQCAHCSDWFQRKLVEIHHVVPCGSMRNWDDIVPFIKNLTCENISGYEILCKACHVKHHQKEKHDTEPE